MKQEKMGLEGCWMRLVVLLKEPGNMHGARDFEKAFKI